MAEVHRSHFFILAVDYTLARGEPLDPFFGGLEERFVRNLRSVIDLGIRCCFLFRYV